MIHPSLLRRLDDTQVEVRCVSCDKTFVLAFSSGQEKLWRAGALIQNVAPTLRTADRELLISSTCDVCFDQLFADEEEE